LDYNERVDNKTNHTDSLMKPKYYQLDKAISRRASSAYHDNILNVITKRNSRSNQHHPKLQILFLTAPSTNSCRNIKFEFMQIPHDLALFAAQSFFLMANLDEELFQSDLRAYQNFAIVWAYYTA